ncbi:flagellar export chaperone FliS [Sphingosinicella soli]|uniref:Flagellar secretion chaperone FliS n=1 Tax=Sphingosinicella soli TaxID=333708 RepID=A0A7W7B4K9_9SPHN|nr:flagellar export chaperone FliS [Sphingosinicella soli]MBB4632807.1 flagellar protein FliS [Sphingosinicella soli]
MTHALRARQQYAAIDTATRTEQASPHRLIEMLYDELLSALRQAGIAIERQDFSLKSSRISRALSILHGLESGLDFNRGGAVAQSLAAAYNDLRQEAFAAGRDNDARRLAAVTDAAAALAEAWRQIRP